MLSSKTHWSIDHIIQQLLWREPFIIDHSWNLSLELCRTKCLVKEKWENKYKIQKRYVFGCMQTMEEMENKPECLTFPEKFRIKQISSTLIFASAVKYISHWQVTCYYFLTPVLFHSQIHGMLLELFDSRKNIDQIITSKKRSSALHSHNTAQPPFSPLLW